MKSSDDSRRALLEQLFKAFNAHDADAVVALMTEDCIFEAAAGPDVFGARFQGRQSVKTAFSNVWASLPDVRWDDCQHFVSGDRAVSTWTFKATRGDGFKIEVEGCDLFTFLGDRIRIKKAFRKDRPAQSA